MRKFNIVDGSKRAAQPCAVLTYDEACDSFRIDISRDIDLEEMPFEFSLMVENGSYSMEDKQSRRWVESRVIPSSRQNLGQVLKAHDMDFYDPFQLLVDHEGRCVQDNFYIREITESADSAECGAGDIVDSCHSVNIGAMLMCARKNAGISQQELAKRAGVQQSLISRLENNKFNPTVNLLADVVAALNKKLKIDIA
ncbi:helix-turn-helix transcriptional regulator [Adlercreutzia sp. ZJ304]|uniref:helix-turn-helix transcriptional regulator n=1 Tax=Adlercreutzia sp. ZJ304 TaxID=2709791 RepID=UPI0013EAA3B0|nr:helix-turn-helix transcriptional regulator [Adlercreutzia sp. ZJ304]